MSSKSVSQIFLSFEVSYVKLKNSFSDEKTSAVKSETSYRKLTWQSIKEKFHHWHKLSSAKLFIVQRYTENANGDVPLTGEAV